MFRKLSSWQVLTHAILMGGCGALVMFTIAIGNACPDLLIFVGPAFLGAVLGGLLTSPWFGHSGPVGTLKFICAALFATLIGSFTAPIFSGFWSLVHWGPVLLFGGVVGAPMSAMIWATGMISIHCLIWHWRTQTDLETRLIVEDL